MIDWHRTFEVIFLLNLGLQIGMAAFVMATLIHTASIDRRRWYLLVVVAHGWLSNTTILVSRFIGFGETWTISWMIFTLLPMLAVDVAAALLFLDLSGIYPKRVNGGVSGR